MYLPDHADLSNEALPAISKRHGVNVTEFPLLPPVGITNAIYALGERLILRVPRNHPNIIATAFREAAGVPAVRRVGVRTPELVAFDDSREIIEVPYAIYERVEGETYGLLGLEPRDTRDAYRCLGRELAFLHEGVSQRRAAAVLCRLTVRLPCREGCLDDLRWDP
jgi:aminoglycoside phosphotransferase (APT) family kinase protein